MNNNTLIRQLEKALSYNKDTNIFLVLAEVMNLIPHTNSAYPYYQSMRNLIERTNISNYDINRALTRYIMLKEKDRKDAIKTKTKEDKTNINDLTKRDKDR